MTTFWSSGLSLLFVSVICGWSAAALQLNRRSKERWTLSGCRAPPPRDLPAVPDTVQTVIVVLGGPTEGTKPGPWLEWRLQAAMKLYRQHPPSSTGFLLTGGRPKSYGSCGAYSEAAVMQRWLEKAGISRGIWREDRSNHTLDNAELSWHRLKALERRGVLTPTASVHIVTQPWHMVKAGECFKVFFSGSSFHMHYESVRDVHDDTMVAFEQESYADMYRVQLKNWLPWQLGFNQGRSGDESETSHLIDKYVSAAIEFGRNNVFFLDGMSAAKVERLGDGAPWSAWSRINDLQRQQFSRTLSDDRLGDGFVSRNSFSRWGSLGGGHLPRYVIAFNPGRDSGDLLGLTCPGKCGRLYNALRVVAYLNQPTSRSAQLKALDLASAWEATGASYSLQSVAVFVLGDGTEATERMNQFNASALSKSLSTAALQLLARA